MHIQVLVLEDVKDLLGAYLPALLVAVLLHKLAKLRVHGLRQHIPEILVHHKGRAALAGLAVYAHDGLVLPPKVRRVYGQVRHFPVGVILLLHGVDALVYGVLV